MSPRAIAALRLVPVHDPDKPGTLSSHLRRLERAWREGQQRREQVLQRRQAARLRETGARA